MAAGGDREAGEIGCDWGWVWGGSGSGGASPIENDAVLEAWQDEAADAIAEQLRAAGLDDLEDLQAWIEAFNDRLDEIREDLADLDELIQDGYLREWGDDLNEAVADVDYPAVEVPDGEGTMPDDALFDSARAYAEHVARVDRYERE